jgi:hypothetical protein
MDPANIHIRTVLFRQMADTFNHNMVGGMYEVAINLPSFLILVNRMPIRYSRLLRNVNILRTKSPTWYTNRLRRDPA